MPSLLFSWKVGFIICMVSFQENPHFIHFFTSTFFPPYILWCEISYSFNHSEFFLLLSWYLPPSSLHTLVLVWPSGVIKNKNKVTRVPFTLESLTLPELMFFLLPICEAHWAIYLNFLWLNFLICKTGDTIVPTSWVWENE